MASALTMNEPIVAFVFPRQPQQCRGQKVVRLGIVGVVQLPPPSSSQTR